jgi:transcriptional regulator with XRE-family HTH domain
MSKLNKTAKLAFYTARKHQGDTQKLATKTGLTTRHINYVLRGERSINLELAEAMYSISRSRKTNSQLANA